MGRTERPYATEAALCERFVAIARAQGFKVYAETAGFDLLLVAQDACPGFLPDDQIGVHAKLAPNVAVLGQALPDTHSGPNYYATLTPRVDTQFCRVAQTCKITAISAEDFDSPYVKFMLRSLRWVRFEPKQPCWVPQCEVIGMPAGVPAPQQLTTWKEKAVNLCLLGESRGFLLRRDFEEAGVSMTRWHKLGWIEETDVDSPLCMKGKRKLKAYAIVARSNPPHLRYPDLARALREAVPCTA